MKYSLGVPSYVRISLVNPSRMVSYSTHKVEFVSPDGSSKDIALTAFSGDITGTKMLSPNGKFYVKLSGNDLIAGRFQRFSQHQLMSRSLSISFSNLLI